MKTPSVEASGVSRRVLLTSAATAGALLVAGCGGRALSSGPIQRPSTPNTAPSQPVRRGEFAATPRWIQDFRRMRNGQPSPEWWNIETGSLIPSWNNEAEFLTGRRRNVRIEDGMLILEARKDDYHGHIFTSGRIDTQNKFTFTRGKLEVDMKLPGGIGTWPAAWVYANGSGEYTPQQLGIKPTEKNQNAIDELNGEADFGEEVGAQPNQLIPDVHTYDNTLHPIDTPYIERVPTMYTRFNTYGVEITDEMVGFTLNGQLYHTVDRTSQKESPLAWPFGPQQELCFILDLAMGGTWGGEDSAQYPPDGIQGNGPWEMLVAAARFYDLAA